MTVTSASVSAETKPLSEPDLAMAITLAPRAAASCTAMAPTPLVAPEISTVLPSSGPSRATPSKAAVPASPSAPASRTKTPSGRWAMPMAAGTAT